jgi:hypothetical protein
MPSSLIIVALAAAWLVVLVPMVARKRQAVAQTTDAELAARVVRSGSGADDAGEQFAMPEPAGEAADSEPAEADEEYEDEPAERVRTYDTGAERRYRPGRGGFDPEAAEIAARAKYAFRQRVVLALIVLAVTSAFTAGFLFSSLWWIHGAIDLVLFSYLGYLRRQVRIEKEIRQRRLARLNHARARRPAPRRSPPEEYEVVEDEYEVVDEYEAVGEYEVVEEPRIEPAGTERRPSPTPRQRGSAVVLDLDDEDPAFHELDDPGQLPFRRAAGE